MEINWIQKVINIIFKTKKVNVLLGFPIFQDERWALNVPVFRKQVKNSPSQVHLSSHMHTLFSQSHILVSLAQRLLCLVSSPPWTSKYHTFFVGWLQVTFWLSLLHRFPRRDSFFFKLGIYRVEKHIAEDSGQSVVPPLQRDPPGSISNPRVVKHIKRLSIFLHAKAIPKHPLWSSPYPPLQARV